MSPVAQVTLAAWALLETGVRVLEAARGRGRRDRDRGTRVLVALGLGAAVVAALLARRVASLRTPLLPEAAGIAVIWVGLAVRAWAIAALGASFRTTVEVDPGQPVVTTGPYRWVRHPSYTGLLLIVAGLGIALGNWLSLAACLVLPLPALLWRIHVEEAELERVLGQAYRAYRSGTARLVPHVW